MSHYVITNEEELAAFIANHGDYIPMARMSVQDFHDTVYILPSKTNKVSDAFKYMQSMYRQYLYLLITTK